MSARPTSATAPPAAGSTRSSRRTRRGNAGTVEGTVVDPSGAVVSGATITVHDDLNAAAALGLGIHLPAQGSVAEARRALGAKALIGISAHRAEELTQAATAGADFSCSRRSASSRQRRWLTVGMLALMVRTEDVREPNARPEPRTRTPAPSDGDEQDDRRHRKCEEQERRRARRRRASRRGSDIRE